MMALPLDLDYQKLSRRQALRKYQRNLDLLREYARENSINDEKFDKLVSDHINRMSMPRKSIARRLEDMQEFLERHRKALFYTVLFLSMALFFSYKREVSTILLRNIQVYIYPVMKLWRRITAPLLLFFPSLTELYDESCLVNNPYFQVDNLNCSPCKNVVNVLDLTNFQHLEDIHDNVPYIFRTNQQPITLGHFMDIYEQNREVFEKDAFKVKSTNDRIKNLRDLGMEILNRTNILQSHNVWRCNRMEPARIIRKFFPHPKRFPQTGMSLERFLLFDTAEAKPYRIPDPECSNAFLTQVQGNRKIVLMPTTECRTECRTISIRLPTSYVLKFNWWYYRPISLPDDISNSESVTYVGSYC